MHVSVCVWVLTVGFLPSLSTVFRLNTPWTVTAPGYKWTASSSDSAELQQDKNKHYELYKQTRAQENMHVLMHTHIPDEIRDELVVKADAICKATLNAAWWISKHFKTNPISVLLSQKWISRI